MSEPFVVSIENSPDVTGTVVAEVTRFDVYVYGDHSSHTDQEHTGFWGQIKLPKPLPPASCLMITSISELKALKRVNAPAYWYATGLLDAAEIMNDFELNDGCEGCEQMVDALIAKGINAKSTGQEIQ